MNKQFKAIAVLSALLTSVSVGADDMSYDSIKERIKPVGSVNLAGADAQAAGGARSPEDIFNSSCTACHTAGVLGAPKPNNASDWKPRLEQGMDVVLEHAIKGFNAMPPKGTCMACSDDEIKAVIEFMIKDL
ncbi:c-type cytochrome [Catenovulum maritimum]|uniref:c-type cytochrome n=1 Tax=Catenovulum maritimum TaxID=1513271 RepID=UPI00399CE047